MTEITNLEIQKRYLQRVETFFSQIENWLPSTLKSVKTPYKYKDINGEHEVNIMTIFHKKAASEVDNSIADICPIGANILLGEGLLEISGMLAEEKLIYFCKDTLLKVEKKPIYQGVNSDGWYFLNSSISNQARLVEREQLFGLIYRVSDYEFD